MTASPRRQTLFSIFLACGSYALFNVADAAVKALGGRFHFSEIVLFASALNLVFLPAYGYRVEGKKAFLSGAWGYVFLRAALLQAMIVCEIFSLSHVQLTTFYTLIFTCPFMVALMSAVFLKEKLNLRRFGIIAAGFAVVLLVFRPDSGLLNAYVPVTLMAAFCYAAQLIATRQVSRLGREDGLCCVFVVYSIGGLLWSSLIAPSHYVAPTAFDGLMFLAYSWCGMLGFIGMYHAFKIAPAAAVLAPCQYTQIGWAAIIGWLAFHEAPDMRVLAGAALLVLLGLYLLWSEARAESKIP